VDEYLSEKEQVELIRRWWRENGWYLIGGAAVAAVGYFGYGQYQRYKTEQAEEASALYADLVAAIEDDAEYAAIAERLENEYGSTPYADQARLSVAREVLISDPERAIAELREVMSQTRDAELAMIARLRLARVLAYRQDYDGALAALDVAAAGQFEARIAEIRGDVHAAEGRHEQARAAYTDALTAPGSEALDRALVQMKLADLPSPESPLEGGA
jgi:predicted negative regulator of RcsB-dependent stress response